MEEKFMDKKFYVQPEIVTIAVEKEQFIATSSGVGGGSDSMDEIK